MTRSFTEPPRTAAWQHRDLRDGYRSPAFEFEAELVFDEAGLVIDYPGIAIRAA